MLVPPPVVAPLETIRTHLMVGSTGSKTVTGVFKWILETEGWPGLFRGNAINVLRIAPSKALEVGALARRSCLHINLLNAACTLKQTASFR